MSGIDIGTTVRLKEDNDQTGTVVSWDDTRHEYLVDLGDEQLHYAAAADLQVVKD